MFSRFSAAAVAAAALYAMSSAVCAWAGPYKPAAVKVRAASLRPAALAARPAGAVLVASTSAAPLADAAASSTSEYTGVLIDARSLADILRSPAPAIYGPAPDLTLVYPDRSCVPTPDEVQDESIVRYYHTDGEAAQGVGGSHPLVITAIAVLGPAKDALQVSAVDMQTLLAVEKSLHFTRTWRVGFLVAPDK